MFSFCIQWLMVCWFILHQELVIMGSFAVLLLYMMLSKLNLCLIEGRNLSSCFIRNSTLDLTSASAPQLTTPSHVLSDVHACRMQWWVQNISISLTVKFHAWLVSLDAVCRKKDDLRHPPPFSTLGIGTSRVVAEFAHFVGWWVIHLWSVVFPLTGLFCTRHYINWVACLLLLTHSLARSFMHSLFPHSFLVHYSLSHTCFLLTDSLLVHSHSSLTCSLSLTCSCILTWYSSLLMLVYFHSHATYSKTYSSSLPTCSFAYSFRLNH